MGNQFLKPGDLAPKPPAPRTETEILSDWVDVGVSPVVSIVCHTFNHGQFVVDALNGFLSQRTRFPFEIIIHDDASTDDTVSIINRYKKEYPKIIKTILQENNQFSEGFRPSQFSFPRAAGRYIAFCEGDDYWIDPNKLSVQVGFLERNPEYVVCYTDSIPFENGTVLDRDYGGAKADLSGEQLQQGPAIFTLTSCFRNVLDNPPEISLVRYGDKFIWSRLGKYGRGKFLDNIRPSMYRVHAGGAHSGSWGAKKNLMYIQTYSAMAVYYARTGDKTLSFYYRKKASEEVLFDIGIHPRVVPFAVNISKGIRFIRKWLRKV